MNQELRSRVGFLFLLTAMLGFGCRAGQTAPSSVAVQPPSHDLKVSGLFSDHMVLQRDMADPVWGAATPGETVTISINGQESSARADQKGKWTTSLKPMPAGGPFQLTIKSGDTTIAINDVLVGEVWLCSGQSNMEFALKNDKEGKAAVQAATNPKIRLLHVAHRTSLTPETVCPDSWVLCSPESSASFTAVGYYFGQELQTELNVPIGLIESSWGGTPVESWTSKQELQSEPAAESLLKAPPPAPPKAATASAKKVATKPAAPAISPWTLSSLYNGMINPLIPYAMRGAIWYQGESNANTPERSVQYRSLFRGMIEDWRRRWDEDEFHFLWVNLAGYSAGHAPTTQPRDSAWADLREAQTMTLKLHNTAQALAIDVGEEKDIHPKDKKTVGHRLALGARAIAYKQEVAYEGPTYDSMHLDGVSVSVKFKHAAGLKTKTGSAPKGFAIAGDDQKFVWAEARIDGSTVVLSNPSIKKPLAVRYAWDYYPVADLYNDADLPAVPFRTDDWPNTEAPPKK